MKNKKTCIRPILMILAVIILGSCVALAKDNSFDYTISLTNEEMSSIPGSDGFSMLLAEYMQDEVFLLHYQENPFDAIAMVMNIYQKYYSSNTGGASVNYTIFPNPYVSVSTIITPQPNGYTCGPAAGYIALYGAGVSGSISGSTHTAKINTLKNVMGTLSPEEANQLTIETGVQHESGTMVYQVRNGLNNYLSSGTYSYQKAASMGENGCRTRVYFSLNSGYIPILHAKAHLLPYYSNTPCYHYIAIQAYDNVNDDVTLYDTNNNTAYYGIHVVSFSTAYSTISSGNRYMIYH